MFVICRSFDRSRRRPSAGWLLGALAAMAAAAGEWPEFRGSAGDGHAPPPGFPLRWAEEDNVAWKTPIPHRGWSTPVVARGRVWLTTAREDGREFFAACLDADDGQVLWIRRLFACEEPEPLGNAMNCYASPSPVIVSNRLFVHFGSYGTACLDADGGATIWSRTDLPCRHYRGPGSSPVWHRGRLILTMDGVDVQYLAALDADTGRTVWTAPRTAEWNDLGPDGRPIKEGDLRKAFSTPLAVVVAGRDYLFSVGARAAYAYDADTGAELWKVPYQFYSAAARPVLAGNFLVICPGPGRPEAWGLGPLTGAGAPPVAWRIQRDAAHIPSPVAVASRWFMISDRGVLGCYEPATGRAVWRERLAGSFVASPVASDGLLLFCNVQGQSFVVRAADRFEPVATNRLDEGCMASPAVAGGALFLRTRTHLYRIGSPPATRGTGRREAGGG